MIHVKAAMHVGQWPWLWAATCLRTEQQAAVTAAEQAQISDRHRAVTVLADQESAAKPSTCSLAPHALHVCWPMRAGGTTARQAHSPVLPPHAKNAPRRSLPARLPTEFALTQQEQPCTASQPHSAGPACSPPQAPRPQTLVPAGRSPQRVGVGGTHLHICPAPGPSNSALWNLVTCDGAARSSGTDWCAVISRLAGHTSGRVSC